MVVSSAPGSAVFASTVGGGDSITENTLRRDRGRGESEDE